jgi:hypothetical protein
VTVHSPNDHLVQALANRDHAEWLLTAQPNDRTAMQWAVAAVFYSALHGISAYLLARGFRITSHLARITSHLASDRVLSNPRNGVPLAVYQAYRDLDDYSRDARYEMHPLTAQEVRDLLDQELVVVAAFVGM